jgi:hypothetical protein
MRKKPLLTLLLSIMLPSIGGTYETDQFTNRQQPIEDSISIMNYQVTIAIVYATNRLHGPRDEMKVVNDIYHKIGGKH